MSALAESSSDTSEEPPPRKHPKGIWGSTLFRATLVQHPPPLQLRSVPTLIDLTFTILKELK